MRFHLSALSILAVSLISVLSCRPEQESISALESKEASGEKNLVSGLLEVELTEEMASKVENGQGLVYPGIKSMERIFPFDEEWEDRHREAGLHRWYRIEYDESLSLTKAAAGISDLQGVCYAGPVRKKKACGFFNDPMFDKQWGLYNDGSRGASYDKGCDINVVPVWERYGAGDPSVIVAVLDEGVQLDHPDLAGVTPEASPGGSKCFISGNAGFKIEPGNHGTHCAGVIAAINNNGTGICGIAGGKDGKGGVRIMSCEMLRIVPNPDDPDLPKTLNGDDAGAFVWAADNGAVIASNSWGFVYETEAEAASGSPRSSKAGIDYFIKYAGCDKNGEQRPDSPMKGGVVIFAAGNETWRHAWPAEYEAVVAVGSVSAKRTRAYYSNYGDWVDICAPGGDVKAGSSILSCIADSRYGNMQGTSMACPHVSGVAALIVSHFGGPGFTNEMLLERLLKGANKDGAPKYSNIGPLVDAYGSFSMGGTEAPEKVEAFESAEVKSNFINLAWKVTADADDVKAYSYLLLASRDRSVLENLDPKNIPSSVTSKTVEVDRAEVGETIYGTLEVPEFESKYFVSIISEDYWQNRSEMSNIMELTTGPNHAPVISTEYSGDYRLKSHEFLSLEFNIYDPDNHAVEITVESDEQAFLNSQQTASGLRLSFNALKGEPGEYTATIRATDKYKMSTDYPIHYVVLDNHAPALSRQMDNIMLGGIGESATIDLSDYFSDPDGEDLHYDINFSVSGVAHMAPNGSVLSISSLGYGLTEASITASDARSEKCSATFMILVPDNSREVDLYPNPVKKELNIKSAKTGPVAISISNKAGATIFSGNYELRSVFEPITIDLGSAAAGTYYVSISGAGIDKTYEIVKI